jgi:hypothetical protein
MNDHPIAYLYNMLFVRIPIILTGKFYLYQLFYQGHPLICDFGFYGGPFEVPALIVLGILYFVLCCILLKLSSFLYAGIGL